MTFVECFVGSAGCRSGSRSRGPLVDRGRSSSGFRRRGIGYVRAKENLEGLDDEIPSSAFFAEELKRLEKELEAEGRDRGVGRAGLEADEDDEDDDDNYDEEKSTRLWEERPEIDFEEELDNEFLHLALDLGFEDPEQLLDALEIEAPESPREILEKEDSFEVAEDSPFHYKTWKPEAYMSSQETAVFLEKPVPVDGIVTEGFGRGSRDVGVPTANIEAAILGVTIASLENGVYFGWARLGKKRRLHGAVLNIGLNPTFGDVKERILEAHLLSDFADDFYGERLGIVILGFLRKEHKFDSFPELVRNIKNDLLTGILMLKKPKSIEQRKHELLVRNGDGDSHAERN
uniref:riboflavin kinase n=1 Tax=Rhodosorus marinus TaxID=101924 RepID=A0A7S2ZQI1_9RHOD|mmetsp:Transcript_27684/g.108563  ORF Transcript_27684/g.108563 Transcript_27684/m.108563 type:complete len:346 (+) Transcript_27684:274-1311(+)|eukprot:CAMPEP_0113964536 /NCGR_PEP_ID=MMETSP0011_2-20120614/7205_1 /TAXON_ID=101924 /ORGANISM="Rhodosorus marinus" /LENGTH=345 /DNA_ID=CAMNT_0000976871 /DNA_START=81 /DNA_END=1118 /DNA_ORIENTATION=- /assembly_acc=CAM_ASM_000156